LNTCCVSGGPGSIRAALEELEKIGHELTTVAADVSNSLAEHRRVEVTISLSETENLSDDDIRASIDKTVDEELRRRSVADQAWRIDEPPFPER